MKQATLPVLFSAALLFAASAPSQASVSDTVKSGPDINEISQRTTLLIVGLDNDGQAMGHGSGSLIARDGNTCVGVTNAHVVDVPDAQFVVRTSDRNLHRVTNVQAFANEDLAVVNFECQGNYEPITIATYQLSPGQAVYLSGWPGDGDPTGGLTRQFTSGSISTVLDQPVEGYQVGYTNITRSGMSGGQVLDDAGRLVAIHGIGTTEDARVVAQRLNVSVETAQVLAQKTGFNYGIPVTTFLGRASQAGLNFPYDVVFSTPQASASGAVTRPGDYTHQPDASDRVSFDDMLGDVNQLLDTFGRVRDIFRF
ncbi:trypsin-like serine protease with c-terminal pdz domain protein [Leptolyngbya sp. Heron Island J]|uniref:S1 family peptidase n=1 Tax=Leptolyngbya sp. Heron Island J TaxID=1385935 RepID=UPI0003B94DC4|nr:serine protease [Leptolyngbya sp. Heron Island J]ESA33953.1 trypsin-like serine protease with c-terminal pdz domain protein [Leptolyngbya sp. Heron Island J]